MSALLTFGDDVCGNIRDHHDEDILVADAAAVVSMAVDSTVGVTIGISTSTVVVVVVVARSLLERVVVVVVVVVGTAVGGTSSWFKKRRHKPLNEGNIGASSSVVVVVAPSVVPLATSLSCSDSTTTGSGSIYKLSLHKGHTALRSDNHRPTHFE